jgi:nitroreductase
MDIREAIYTRRAVREFTSEPVSESIIRDLIDAAVQAPAALDVLYRPGHGCSC